MDRNNLPPSGWIWLDTKTGGAEAEKEYGALSSQVQVVYFRKELELGTEEADLPRSFLVHLSADSRYKFYVNGILVSIGPEKGDRHVWFYETVDLATYLHLGKNVLAAIVLRYPLPSNKGNHSVWRTEIPGFYMKGTISWGAEEASESGQKTGQEDSWSGSTKRTEEFLADESFRAYPARHVKIVSESPFFAPLQIFEQTEGHAETADWMKEDFDASGWNTALPYSRMQVHQAVSPGNLLERPIPLLYQKPERFEGVMTIREIPEDQVGRENLEGQAGRENLEGQEIPEGQAGRENLEGQEIPEDQKSQGEVAEKAKTAGKGGLSGRITAWNGLLRKDTALTIPAHSREVVEINAGELTTGYLRLALAGGKEARLHLLYSESYSTLPDKTKPQGPGNMPVKRDRMDWQNGELYGYADDYTAAGYGKTDTPEVFEPFWFRTFRFLRLEIETGEEALTVARLDYRETGYPLEVKTWVKTSDETLDAVWDISERTLRRCMHETYEDCPFYEQLQYIMDSRSQMLFTYQVAANDRLARKCMDDFKRSVRYDGLLNCSYPSYAPNVIPGFSIYYIWMLYDHMMYFGDKELLRYHMPTVDGILEYFRRNLNEQGLIAVNGGYLYEGRYWSFIDWVKEWRIGVPNAILHGPVTMESFLYIYGLQAAAKLAEYLDRESVAKEYEQRAEAVKESIRRHCIGENGLYQDGPGFEEYSQHCQVFAVLTGTAGQEEGKRILTEVTDSYYGAGKEYPRCSVAMAYYMFRALEQVGLYERTERLWDVWREMVKNNGTTCVENDTDGRSDCHAWGSLALYELPAVVLGVRPTAPGYAEFSVKPQAGYYTSAEGEVITPKGLVRVAWKKAEDGNLEVEWKLV